MANKAVFIDRDGTMARDVHYCSLPEDFELLPGVVEGIRLLNEHGFKVVVVTNQSGIARGYFTEETLKQIHQKMEHDLAKGGARIDATYYCPHHPDEDCACRKPKPKMLLDAARDFEIDLPHSYVIGDVDMDIKMGQQVGCKTLMVRSSSPLTESVTPDVVVANVLVAARIILKWENNGQGNMDTADAPGVGSEQTIWEKRSEVYDQLQWVKEHSYLDAFVKAGDFKRTDLVLDVGTGTGIVARAVAPLVSQVVGLDKSQAMLEHSNWQGNMYFVRRDVLNPLFKDEVFDKVTARHVFHHILLDTQQAMNECYRVLKKGGRMIFSEGVPPCLEVKQDYIEIFRLKEKRLTFMEEDLAALMQRAGFKDIQVSITRLRGMSVRNWLMNSGLPQPVQDKIFDLHINAKDYFKRAYNMAKANGDCLIDMKMAILVGAK
jgi:D-glycero-D-manno-heptose 1,7-bisphosphate phosphatase